MLTARAALSWLALLGAIAALWIGRDFAIPMAVSVVLAVLLAPLCASLTVVVRSRTVAALLSVALTVALAAGVMWALAARLSATSERLPSVLRLAANDIGTLGTERALALQRTRAALSELDRSVARVTGTARALPASTADKAAQVSIVTGIVDGAGKLALTASKSVFGVLVQCGVVALLTFFLLLGGPRLGASFAQWCAASGTPACRVPALEESTRQVRLFARVTLLTNVLIGGAVALVLASFAVPDAGLWGVAAGTLHFVPYAGLLLMMGLAAIEVYAAQSSLWAGLAAAGLVGSIGIVIGTAVQTWLQGRAAKVDSAVLFAGTLFWAVLWGGWGLVLGPLMVVVARLAWRDRVAAAAPAPAPAQTADDPAAEVFADDCRKAPTPPAAAPADNRQREFTAPPLTLPDPAPP